MMRLSFYLPAILALLIIPQLALSSSLETYNYYLRKGQIQKCTSGKRGCYSVLAPKNSRDIHPLLGYLQVDYNNGIVYAQDIKTKKIKGFRYQAGDDASLGCIVKYAHEYVVEQYLEMNIQTNVRPNCY